MTVATTQTDNAALHLKVALRRHLLRRYHADGDIRVFDACQGDGLVWNRLRAEFPVKTYWGVDIKPGRGRIRIDSRRILCQRRLDSNIVDIDTYGFPWSHWGALLSAVTEPTTVFLTVAIVLKQCRSKVANEVRSVLRLPHDWPVPNAMAEALNSLATDHFLSLRATSGLRVSDVFECVQPYSRQGSRPARYIGVRLQ